MSFSVLLNCRSVRAPCKRRHLHWRPCAVALAAVLCLSCRCIHLDVTSAWITARRSALIGILAAGSCSSVVADAADADLFQATPAPKPAPGARMRGLMAKKPRPELGISKTNLELFEGQPGPDGFREISGELKASASSRVLLIFDASWPTALETGGNGIQVKNVAGDSAFVQVVKGSDVDASVDDFTASRLLDTVLSAKGKFGAYGEPENVQVLKDKVTMKGDQKYRTIEATFNGLTRSAFGVPTRLLISATVADGDAFLLVGTARDVRWANVEPELARVVGSFRARVASSAKKP